MSKKKRKAVGCRGYTMEEFIEVAREKFGETISYDKTVYKNVKSDIVVTCKSHGDFKTKPEYFLRSPTGCLKCGKSVNLEEFVLRSLKRHGDKYSYDKVVYKNTSTPVEITCTKHGSFWCEPYSHYRKGSGCPMCARERGRLTTADFVARSKKAHCEKYDYSRTIYKTEKDTVEIICPEHGLFSTPARSHMAGHGCMSCSREKTILGREEFIKKAREIHGDKYDYSEVIYVGNKKSVKIICPDHGPFRKKPNSHISSKSGCPVCSESKRENSIRVFLEKHRIKYIREYKVKPYKFRYDFYLPDFGILIEFNGHQHYRPVNFFGGAEEFERLKQSDFRKKLIAKENELALVVLTYKQANENILDRALIGSLKRHYAYWFNVDGRVKAFRNIFDVYQTFNVPMDVLTRELIKKVEELHPNVKSLF